MSIKKLALDEDSSLQDFLSIGYIFLIVLGIIKDSIFYYFLDINIIEYSSISDILLSPISFFTDGLRGLGSILILVLMIQFTSKIAPKIHQKYRTKWWYEKTCNVEKWDKKYAKMNDSFEMIQLSAVMMICFFLGTGLGSGSNVSQKLKDKELTSDYQMTFHNNEVKNVKIVGQNSQYVFYVLEENDKVSISPIQGNVAKMEQLEEVED